MMHLTSMPMSASPGLAASTNGMRLVAVVFALAILINWMPSVWRILRGQARHPGDTMLAPWVPLAVAVLIFQIRWFWPNLDQLMKDRLTFVAQGGMTMALLFAIYVHGRHTGVLRLRRALLLHAGMLMLCIGASSILR